MSLPTVTFDSVVEYTLYRLGLEQESPPSADYNDVKAILNMRLRECWEYAQWDFLKVLVHEDTRADAYVVSGAGTVAVDGYYARRGDFNTFPRYSQYESDGVTVAIDLLDDPTPFNQLWRLRNPDGSVTYYTSGSIGVVTETPPDQGWIAASGDDPAPSVTRSVYRSIDLSDGRTVFGVWAEDPRENEHAQMVRTSFFNGTELRLDASAPDWVYYHYAPAAPDWLDDSPTPTVYEVFRQPAVELAASDYYAGQGNTAAASQAKARGIERLDELCRRYAQMNTQPRVQARVQVPQMGWGR
ncbi:MAG: hypothetical protein AAGJ81_10765 [Verrucomicrobiota bacterium]